MFRYDASSKVSESSFNEFVGDIPTKYTDRFSVLARFGKHKVALIADISKAFFYLWESGGLRCIGTFMG